MSRHTLAARHSHTAEVKHSRFVAHAAPVDTPEEAQAFLREVAVREATHNCWAWRIGGDYRSSDDGEPAGTAGRPILAAIDGQGLDRVAVVVVRWYGGIKLGAGGLVRAYGGTAAECLRLAPRLPLVVTARMRVLLDFADVSLLHQLLSAYSASKLDEAFDAGGARIVLELPADRLDALKTRLRDATRDRARFEDQG
jgi:uncharacterized YigZ family protein